ncbi:hypothetical protein CPB86DRAFT_788565 [Serendipita vermifera]|nr:hypothetical protein CPB86DRAFT_788565 [Serendipita vermifera]
MELKLVDSVAHEDYEKLRTLEYPGADVILIIFSVDSPESLERVDQKWLPEASHFRPGTPIILVGCKTDLRHNRETIDNLARRGKKPVSREDGEQMGKRIGATAYLECSSRTGDGVAKVFQTAATIVCSIEPEKKTCIVF